jgi:hypothetical protein
VKKILAMVSTNELISLINKYSLTERLKIIEEVLRGIREEKVGIPNQDEGDSDAPPKILELAGIMTEEEASEYMVAIEESRKIDKDEW